MSVIWARLLKVSPMHWLAVAESPYCCSPSLHMAFFTMQLGAPYWSDPEEGSKARWQLAGVVALTLGTTGVRCAFRGSDTKSARTHAQAASHLPLIPRLSCSVLFNFLGRDFFNALSEKDAERFTQMLIKWLGGVVLGVPVFVFRDYLQVKPRSFAPVSQLQHAPCHADIYGTECVGSRDWRWIGGTT